MKQNTLPPLKMADILALDRTRLANERTFLAYSRSAFALLVAGVSLLKVFSQDLNIVLMGTVFIGLSPLLFGIGLYRTYRFQARWAHYFEYSPEDIKEE